MKNVVITGSTRGIGFGLALNFLKRGCTVTINGTSDQSVKKALNKLGEYKNKGKIARYAGSVTDENKMESLYQTATDTFGDVDIWVNNAGVSQPDKLFFEFTETELSKVLDINVKGVMIGSKVAFSHMVKAGYGKIFNMEGFGSDGRIMKSMTVYGTSKRAVNYLTKSMAKEAEDTNVQIGVLSPGMVLTDFLLNSIKDNPKKAKQNKKIFNILADRVQPVTEYLVDNMLKSKKNYDRIEWLTKTKIMYRFLTYKITKRNIFEEGDL